MTADTFHRAPTPAQAGSSEASARQLAAANDQDACRAQLEDNRRLARELYAGCSEAQLIWRPSPGSWSMAECLTHLNRSGRIYIGAIDRGIEDARRRGLTGKGPYRHPWFGRWFIGKLDVSGTMKLKSPGMFAPAPATEGSSAGILEEFEAIGRDLEARLEASRGIDLGRARVTSPVIALIRVSLGQSFSLMAAHERRHLEQARRVTLAPGFPGKV